MVEVKHMKKEYRKNYNSKKIHVREQDNTNKQN